jgi:DNA-binding NtrC family response regulator
VAYEVLIVEDEAILARNIGLYLSRAGFDTRVAGSAEEGLAQLKQTRPEVVLLDFNLPGMDGLECIERIRAIDAQIKIVMMTGQGSVDLAVSAMKAGAYDFLSKPLSMSKLKLMLDKAMSEERQAQTLSYYRAREARESGIDKLVGDSSPMRRLRDTLRQIIASEEKLRDDAAPAVLITGETGTGKELVARSLHFDGPRCNAPFVEINCASIPAHLLESELFGYERGSFTDAHSRKLGLVETAEGGTLFLDEIGDMDFALQAKLLKLLEDKTVRRIGSLRDQRVNVRIVTATHRPLEKLVATGKFRSDLFYRLSIVHLRVPALRDRDDDIVLLARHYLAVHGERYGKSGLRFTPPVEALLRRHRWPGNVRELRNVVEQAVLMSCGPLIDAIALNPLPDAPAAQAAAAPEPDQESNLVAMEREALLRALQRAEWNVTQAAKTLGISRDTLRYRMAKFQLSAVEAR